MQDDWKTNEVYLNMFKDDLQYCYNIIGKKKYKELKTEVTRKLYEKYLINESKKSMK